MIFGVLYLGCFLISILIFILLFQMRQTGIAKRLMVLSVLIAFWLLMEGLSFYLTKENYVMFFQKWKYISVIFVPPVLVYTAIQFIHKIKGFSLALRVAFFIIPFISFISMASGQHPYEFIADPKIYFDSSIPIFEYTKKIGFLIHTGYSYVLILYTCFLLSARMIHSPQVYRLQSLIVLLGCAISMGLNMLFVSGSFGEVRIDTTPIFVLITLIVFYFGSFILPKTLIIPYARNLLVENMKDLVFVVDNADQIIDVNPTACQIVKQYSNLYRGGVVDKIQLIGVSLDKILQSIPFFSEIKVNMNNQGETTLCFQSENKSFWYRMAEEEIFDADQNKIGRLFLLHDVTQMQEYLNRVICMNERLQVSDQIIENSLEGILISDSQNRIVRVNSSLEKMSGYSNEELIGKFPNLFRSERHDRQFYEQMWESIKNNGFWEGEIWDKRKSGEIYPKWMSITTIKDQEGQVTNYIAISSDLSKMKKAENKIQLLAYYDSLTGIPNRTLFYDRLQTALVRTKRSGFSVALFTIDIDGFKIINDHLGHAAGDELLIALSQRIKQNIRESDTLSRVGGDEFTLILENIDKPKHVRKFAENLLKQIHQPYFIVGQEVIITVSIGIAQAPYEEMTAEGMIRKSDMAMHYIKRTGGGKFIFSSEEMERRNQELYSIQADMKRALRDKEFILYLQPQMAMVNGKKKIIGAEALIRWKNPDNELISPMRFIPAAEANGLIVPIGSWVMEEVFRIQRVLQENDIHIKVAFNVSVRQFEDDAFLPLLRYMKNLNSDMDVSLAVEITESLFIDDLDTAIQILNEIKELGVQIALDDFGTGFSSMSYLTKLPIDYLKIDQSFVAEINQYQGPNLALMIIQMAKSMGLLTIAEGVESFEQEEQLLQAKCDILQGYYYARPLPLNDFVDLFLNY